MTRRWLRRLGVFSASFAALLSPACNKGLIVDVCISNARTGFVCVDKDEKAYFVSWADSFKFIAFTPSDAEAVLQRIGMKPKVAEQLVAKYTGMVDH